MNPSPTKGPEEWEAFYRDPQNFGQLFSDYLYLKTKQNQADLSTQEGQQFAMIEQIIEAKLGL